MPKHYESDKDPKLPPKTNNNYKKKDVFETKAEKPKKSKKSKKSKSKKSSY